MALRKRLRGRFTVGADPPLLRRRVTTFFVALVTLAGLGLAGWIDYATGEDIAVAALYYIPLSYCAMRLGQPGAVLGAVAATAIWLVSFAVTATHPIAVHVYVVDFVSEGAAFLFVGSLIARIETLRRRDREHARRDALTGLDTRIAFVEHAGVALALCRRHGRPVTLAFIDLNRFKQVNDTVGHARGDMLLKTCGATIAGALRASDVAGRFGGDEFVVLLPETGDAEGREFCENLRRRIDAHVELVRSGVTASVGVVVDPRAATSLDALLAHADERMYASKRAGGEVRCVILDDTPRPDRAAVART